jgi:hypothetical protein
MRHGTFGVEGEFFDLNEPGTKQAHSHAPLSTVEPRVMSRVSAGRARGHLRRGRRGADVFERRGPRGADVFEVHEGEGRGLQRGVNGRARKFRGNFCEKKREKFRAKKNLKPNFEISAK